MLPDKYNSQEIEAKWQKIWEEDGVYKWTSGERRENNFSIDTPPPTVSGLLHMGHIFSYTQTDFVARFQRMFGKNVYYPIGFDDNGLPTERLVEKVKEIRAASMPRAEFIKQCEEVVAEAEEEFRALFREIGLSVDWSLEYQTISKEVRKISQMSFLDLYEKSLVERRHSPTFWDPVDQTAIAQAEMEDKEQKGVMYEVVFKDEDNSDLIIATTRPELIPAVVAVFYHPEDERYKHLAGKNAITPIFSAKVPIIADEAVMMDKGTGLVMCATFGDIQDIDWWRKYKLSTKECIDIKGRMINAGSLDGLKVKEAKAKIVEELDSLALVKAQTEVTQFVKCAERSKAPLEIVPTHQWYVKLLEHKAALKAKSDVCNWFPNYMKLRLENWIEGLNQDWCISRQRFFGVPFPVWYSKRSGEEGKVLLAKFEQLPVDPFVDLPEGYSSDEVEPDFDVMDTWATSSITPQINALAINDKLYANSSNSRYSEIYPFDIRPQAHEIIRTWAFYTIVKSHFHADSIPWKNLMISGWCLASDKTKMSKSKGNVVTPKALIVEKGADVVRYWASTSKLGVDTAYSEELFKIGKKLITKLWNASKFAALHLAKLEGKEVSGTISLDVKSGVIFEEIDLWILSRLYTTIEVMTKEFQSFEYCDARVKLEEFFWKDFCDNYMEIVKGRIYDEEGKNRKGQMSAVYTVYHCLKHILILFAPFIPYTCEELYTSIFKQGSVHKRGIWPKISDGYYSAEVEAVGNSVVEILELVRKYKSTENISLRAELESVIFSGSSIGDSALSDLKNAANASNMEYADSLDSDLSSADGKYKIVVKKQIDPIMVNR
jgi:valyl-tRNA synthetase